jgi:hypothetical protein
MICHALNTIITKKEAYWFIFILVSHAIWVTMYTDVKIIGKGYRRNLFSVRNLNSRIFTGDYK